MAESQIAGLFMTPEMYRRQQMQEADQQAVNFARMSPREQASYGFFSAGQGLGQAARTLLGAQDPQLQRITEQQQLLQGLDVANPESLMEAARRASQAGNTQLAMQLAQQARQAVQDRDVAEQRQLQMNALRQTAEEQERQRVMNAEVQRVAQGAVQMSPATIQGLPVSESMPLRDDEGNLMPGANPEALSLNIEAVAPLLATMGPAGSAALKGLIDARNAMLPRTQVLGRDQRLVDPQTREEIVPALPREEQEKQTEFVRNLISEGLRPGTPEFQQRVAEFNRARVTGTERGQGTTVVLPATRAENEYARVAGAATAKRDIETIDNASAVATNLPKMYETRQLLETGNLNTGILAEYQQIIDRSRKKFLGDQQAGRVVNDTEYLNALLGSDVFPQISALGIGARGLDTPAEREFLREVITGTIQMDRNTLKRMTDFRIRSAERAVEDYNKRLNAGEFKQFQTVTGRTLAPIPVRRGAPGTPGNPIRLD